MTDFASPRYLILAFGNPDAGDDAAGLKVAAGLPAKHRSHCTIRQHGDPLAILDDDVNGFDAVLIVDAVHSGAPPGTVHFFRLSAAQLRAREIASASTHGIGLAEIVALAEAVGRRLPPLILLGIEGADFRFGSPMCDEVRDAVQTVVANFDEYCRRMQGESTLGP